MQEFTVKDAESIYKIANQPEIAKFYQTGNQRKNKGWIADYEIPANKAFLDAVKTTNNIDNHMLKLGIFKKATNELIGWCCTGMKEELPSPNREIMYAISNEYQNHGYATKATKGLIDYLFKETNLNVLTQLL